MEALDFAVKTRSIQIGHTDIAQDHIIGVPLKRRELLAAVGCQGEIVTAALEQALQGALHRDFIVNEQNPAAMMLRHRDNPVAMAACNTCGRALSRSGERCMTTTKTMPGLDDIA